MNLWQITDDLGHLADRLIESGGVLTEDDESLLAALSEQFDAKIERIGQLVRALRVDGQAAKAEADRLAAMAKARESSAARLEEYIARCMREAQVQRVDTPTIQVRRVANSAPTIRWVGEGKGIEYEFDMLVEMSTEHYGSVIKDRTGRWQDKIIEKPGEDFGRDLRDWLADGTPPPPPVITQEQRVALVAKVKQVTTPEAFVAWLKATHGIDGTAGITQAILPAINEHLEEMRRAQEAA